MAESVKVIDPDLGSGYDYDSLYDWEAAQQADIDASGTIAVAKCRCTAGTADTTAVTIDGWTTSAADYIKIWTDPSESYRHNGTWQTSNKYRLSYQTGFNGTHAIYNAEAHLKIIGLQIEVSNGEGYPACINSFDSVNLTISDCVLRKEATRTSSGGIAKSGNTAGTTIINNCILYDFSNSGIYHAAWTGCQSIIYSNTIVNCTIGIEKTDTEGITARCINNILSDCDTAIVGTYSSGSGYNATNNVSLNYTVTGGATADRVSQTFTFVGAADFHLASNDAGALGYGLNLYNDANYPFQTDIDGDDRGGAAAAWDIGADEYVAAAADSIVPILLNRYRARRQ